MILVEGGIGTGKTTLGTEFVYRGASEFDEPGIIVLFEVSPDKLVRDAARFGWDLKELERQRRLKIVFTTRHVFQQELQQTDSLLLSEADDIGARRIFVDGVAGLASGPAGSEPREIFHVLVEGLQRENLTALLALEAATLSDGRPIHEESIADTLIRLRLEENQRATTRSIEIVKSRGQKFQMGRHSFHITEGRGLEVYRRVQAPRPPSRERVGALDPQTRITTGVPGLDEVTSGGYFHGSTTVVAGISGVGKSVMGLQYIAHGAGSGERSLMLSLDEQVPQILRNAGTIGIDLQPHLDAGLVRVEYDLPQEIEVDQHFHKIEQIIEDFRPRRVLIDSLSTYGTTLGPGGRVFRDFFHALVALMKEHRVAAVYNHENPELLGMSSMMGNFQMSSLVDNIILMNWIELGDTFRLGLTVAKMRASPTRQTTYECEIVEGAGMRVLPREVHVAPPNAPFNAYYGSISRSPERRPAGSASGPKDDSTANHQKVVVF